MLSAYQRKIDLRATHQTYIKLFKQLLGSERAILSYSCWFLNFLGLLLIIVACKNVRLMCSTLSFVPLICIYALRNRKQVTNWLPAVLRIRDVYPGS
jgi:hypothetical protein